MQVTNVFAALELEQRSLVTLWVARTALLSLCGELGLVFSQPWAAEATIFQYLLASVSSLA